MLPKKAVAKNTVTQRKTPETDTRNDYITQCVAYLSLSRVLMSFHTYSQQKRRKNICKRDTEHTGTKNRKQFPYLHTHTFLREHQDPQRSSPSIGQKLYGTLCVRACMCVFHQQVTELVLENITHLYIRDS